MINFYVRLGKNDALSNHTFISFSYIAKLFQGVVYLGIVKYNLFTFLNPSLQLVSSLQWKGPSLMDPRKPCPLINLESLYSSVIQAVTKNMQEVQQWKSAATHPYSHSSTRT